MDKTTKRMLLFIGMVLLGVFWGPLGVLAGFGCILIFG